MILDKIHKYKELFFALDLYLQLLLYALFVLVFSLLVVPAALKILQSFFSKTKTDLDDKIFDILHKPVFWSSVLLGALLAPYSFSADKSLTDLFVKFIASALIFIWTSPLSKIINLFLERASKHKRSFIKHATLPLFKNVSLIVVWSLAIYAAFNIWGISLTAWLASAGIVGIAVGFAAKDTLANLISGIFILADSPYKVGDIIRLSSGEVGEVLHVGLRSTRIKTFDGVEVTIPNATMGNSMIMNETGSRIEKKYRLKIPIGVSYDSDISQVEKILLDIANSEENVCKEPEPKVFFLNFGDSALELELRVWLPDPKYKGVKDKINRRILEAFRKANIEIPYPKRDVYLFNQE